MARLIIILTGRIATGKTVLAANLAQRFGAHVVKTRELIKIRFPDADPERATFQELGDKLDRQTGGQWVCEALSTRIRELPGDALVVIDSARIEGQIDAVRQGYGRRVVHIHLTAPDDELKRRYADREDPKLKELSKHEDTLQNPTERAVPELQAIADVVIDTKESTKEDVLVRAAGHIGLFPRGHDGTVDVLVGGQYGSEGKGQIAAFLSHEYDLLIRVGGPNAGHTVFLDPRPYTFHHIPSGALSSEARLMLGPGAAIYVPTLLKEIADCKIDSNRLSIDPQAIIITDADREKEDSLRKAIASTAQGVGHAAARRIIHRGAEGDDRVLLAKDIPDLRPYVRDTQQLLDQCFRDGSRLLLEGTQGTGLSLFHGQYPYVTSRDTTVAGCLAEAGIAPSRTRRIVMVCRTYPIRVQDPEGEGKTSGPMSQPITLAEIARRSGLDVAELQKAERTSTTNRQRRFSEFDWMLLRRSASLNGPTDVALTFVDYFGRENRQARRFEQLTPETIRFVEEIERIAAAPVTLISTRFHSRSIIDRRAW